MSDWLSPVREALDRAAQTVTFFFRDDDAGWDDSALLALLDRFEYHGVPIDLAVIPAALSGGLAEELARCVEKDVATVALHQHGYAHLDHETEGRGCEFGPNRSAAAQRRDLTDGRARLQRLLGPALDPTVFTPPWNRCTATTGRLLASLGFRVLSRDSGVAPLAVPGLDECPIHIDWLKRRQGQRLSLPAIAGLIAARIEHDGPVGVMLHHAALEHSDLVALDDLLNLLTGHTRALCGTLREAWPRPGRLILVRHGRTEWNGHRYLGRTDVPLAAEGNEQSRRLATRLEGIAVDAVFSSPLVRARSTAAPFADARRFTVEVDDDLVEMDFGALEGLSREDGRRLRRSSADFLGSESRADLRRRAERFLERVAPSLAAGETVLAIGHYRLNRELFAAIVEDSEAVAGYRPRPGSAVEIVCTRPFGGALRAVSTCEITAFEEVAP